MMRFFFKIPPWWRMCMLLDGITATKSTTVVYINDEEDPSLSLSLSLSVGSIAYRWPVAYLSLDDKEPSSPKGIDTLTDLLLSPFLTTLCAAPGSLVVFSPAIKMLSLRRRRRCRALCVCCCCVYNATSCLIDPRSRALLASTSPYTQGDSSPSAPFYVDVGPGR